VVFYFCFFVKTLKTDFRLYYFQDLKSRDKNLSWEIWEIIVKSQNAVLKYLSCLENAILKYSVQFSSFFQSFISELYI